MDVALTARELATITLLYHCIAGALGLGAAWFEFRESGQTDTEKARTRRFYKDKWEAIERARLRHLPEMVIAWLLEEMNTLPGLAVEASKVWLRSHRTWLVFVCAWSLTIGLGVAAARSWRWGLVATVISLCALKITANDEWPKTQTVTLGVLGVVAAILWPRAVVVLPVGMAAAVLCLTLPFFAPTLGFVGGSIAEEFTPLDIGRWCLFGFSVAVSMVVTVLALTVGAVAAPSAPLPLGTQMLGANILCDGFTVSVTVAILRRALNNKPYSIPVAVGLGLIAAGALACVSLWLGVVGTQFQLSPVQVLHVLVGRTPGGGAIELGPFFWSMHTAFLPALAYLCLLLACWLGRLAILPVYGLFERGKELDNPHHHTAMLFTLLAVIVEVVGTIGKQAVSTGG